MARIAATAGSGVKSLRTLTSSVVAIGAHLLDLDFDIVWAAEIRNLYSQKFINTVKRTGRTFYAVSPDIHRAPEILHPRAYAGYDFTWKELIAWCVDGICTDFPYMLKRQLK